MVSVADDALAKVWRTSDWSLMTTFSGHTKDIYAAEYIGNDRVATGALGRILAFYKRYFKMEFYFKG